MSAATPAAHARHRLDALPPELVSRVWAHVLGLTLGGRTGMRVLWQYRHEPQRTRAACLALELKRLAGLLGVPWASAGEPGGDLGGGVEIHDWEGVVAEMKRESRLRYEGRQINPRSRRALALDLAATEEQLNRCGTNAGCRPLWRTHMELRYNAHMRRAE